MLQFTFIFVGLVALTATAQTLRTADDQLAILSGLIGALSWGLWSYSALDVVIISNGTQYAASYPSLAAFGVALVVPNLFVALTGPLRIARNPDDLAEEAR